MSGSRDKASMALLQKTPVLPRISAKKSDEKPWERKRVMGKNGPADFIENSTSLGLKAMVTWGLVDPPFEESPMQNSGWAMMGQWEI